MNELKHIAVFMDGSDLGKRLGQRAASLARDHGAHLVGVFGVSRADSMSVSTTFVRGSAAIQGVIAHQRKIEDELALSAGRQFSDLVLEYGVSSEFRVIWNDSDSDRALDNLHCDLIVTAQPKPEHLPASWSAEHLLLRNGGPILLVPDEWPGDTPGGKIVIAWNGSAKARRAVNDALPLLVKAREVTILIVDSDKYEERLGDSPGSEVQDHLARHGVTAGVREASSEGLRLADVIAAQADLLEADIVVIGAYSHSRSSEAIFGGVTRTLLTKAPRPLFIAH